MDNEQNSRRSVSPRGGGSSGSDSGAEATGTPRKMRCAKATRRSNLNLDVGVQDAIPSKKLKVEEAEEAIDYDVNSSPVSSDSQKATCSPLIPGVAGEEGGSDKKTGAEGRENNLYQVKWIVYNGNDCPIVTQNENGPCPLIAICNVMLLRGHIKLNGDCHEVAEAELVTLLHNIIMDKIPKEGIEINSNLLQNVQDAVALLPSLALGLNVNVRFTGVRELEFTKECVIFDTLGIQLYHAWVIDPQCHEVLNAIGSMSYNKLVETVVENKASNVVTEKALMLETFLESTASQLTVHGLFELNSTLKKGELAILFRNNHFIVVLKHENLLLQLVTDQGFINEPDVVWETLCTINGDEIFLDGYFSNIVSQGATSSLNTLEEQQISQDFLVALSLQDEQNKQQDKEFGWDAYGNALGAIGMNSDEKLAKQLHIEEKRVAKEAAKKSGSPIHEVAAEAKPSSSSSVKTQNTSKEQEESSTAKGWKCIIS